MIPAPSAFLLALAFCPLPPFQSSDDLDRWIVDLRSEDAAVAKAADEELSRMRPALLATRMSELLALLGNERVSIDAAWILAKLPEAEYPALLERAWSIPTEGREHLAEALAFSLEVGNDLAEPLSPATALAIERGLLDADSGLRRFAATLIDAAGPRLNGSFGLLEAGLLDSDPLVRATCANALGTQSGGDPSRLESLMPLLRDADTEVQEQAVLALSRSVPPLSNAVLEALLEVSRTGSYAARVEALERMGETGADPRLRGRLLEALEEPIYDLRGAALEALWRSEGAGEIPSIEVESTLSSWLLEADSFGRSRALNVAERLGRAALPSLRQGLGSTSSSVQLACALAFPRVGARSDEAIEALVPLLPVEAGGCTAGQVVGQLRHFGADVAPALAPLVSRSSEWKVGSRLVSLLEGCTEDPLAARLLTEIIDQSTEVEVRVRAYSALSDCGPRAAVALPVLERRLRSGLDPDEILRIVSLLGDLGPTADTTAPTILELLRGLQTAGASRSCSDNELARACCRALGRLGDPIAASTLSRLARSEDLGDGLRNDALEGWAALDPTVESWLREQIESDQIRRWAQSDRWGLAAPAVKLLSQFPAVAIDDQLLLELVVCDSSPWSGLSHAVYQLLTSRPELGRRLLPRILETKPLDEGLGFGFQDAASTLRPPAEILLPRLLEAIWYSEELEDGRWVAIFDEVVLETISLYRPELRRASGALRSQAREMSIRMLEYCSQEELLAECVGWTLDLGTIAFAITDLGGEAILGDIFKPRELDRDFCNWFELTALIIRRLEVPDPRAIQYLGRLLSDEHSDYFEFCCVFDEAAEALAKLGPAARSTAPALVAAVSEGRLQIVPGLRALAAVLEGSGERPALLDRIQRKLGDEDLLESVWLDIAEAEIAGRPVVLARNRLDALDDDERETILEMLGGRVPRSR